MLTSVFGISIKYEAWNHQDSLPVYIAGSYDFHTAYIGNRRCIMLAPTEELATLELFFRFHNMILPSAQMKKYGGRDSFRIAKTEAF